MHEQVCSEPLRVEASGQYILLDGQPGVTVTLTRDAAASTAHAILAALDNPDERPEISTALL